MKKIFISFLIMTLTLANISLVNIASVQAATTDNTGATSTDNTSVATTDNTIKVSLDSIRGIVTENNLEIKSYANLKQSAQETYDDAKSTYTSKTEPTKAAYTTSTTDATGTVTSTYDSAGYDTALSAYDTAQTAYKNAKADLKTARENYEKNIETNVSTAQSDYLTYLYDLSMKKINEDTVKSNEKAAQIYKLQYESGFISKNAYTDAIQANTSVNDSNASKDTEELDRVKLCNALGISPEENITFDTDINQNFEIIAKINYEDDLKKMLDNNIAIKDQNDAISDLEDQESDYDNKDESDIYDYKLESENNTLQQLINTKETDFKDKYNALMKSYNEIKSSYDVILQKQKEYQVTQIQYEYGFISKNGAKDSNALDTVKLTLDTANAAFIKSRNACYLLYLQYIQMKEGY